MAMQVVSLQSIRFPLMGWQLESECIHYMITSLIPETRNTDDFKSQFFLRFERDVFYKKFDDYYHAASKGNHMNTYDRQMNYLVCKYHKLSIYPNINLVTNIGFDYGGTNTSMDPNSNEAKAHTRPRYEFEEIIHPASVSTDNKFEYVLFLQRLLGGVPIWKASLKIYIKILLKR
jgi:hypothetical protein